MIVVSSINGKIGLSTAVEVLKAGGSALDAVEAGTCVIERNAADHSVGRGGLPNLLGEVRLDASIMEGRTLRAGAVGAVRGYVHAITLARRVMEETLHVLLVADGAERLARETGVIAENPLTPEAEATWRQGLLQRRPDCDPGRLAEDSTLRYLVRALDQPMAGWPIGASHGTVNFLAQDRDGNLATAVSTSGWPWGYPGRLGDSPIIGAGGYADNRWGAVASTGTGEVTIRMSTTRSVILYMKMGMSLAEALQEALTDLRDLRDPYADHIALIGVDRSGNHAGYSRRRDERYAYMTEAMGEPAERESVNVA